MAGALTELSVAGKLPAKSLGRRLRSEIEAPPDLVAFEQGLQRALDAAPPGVIRDVFRGTRVGYNYPLPNWQGKEFHVVVRSGQAGLGEWQDERRNLMDDYKHYMGKPPRRIVKVWLIANSIFQRGEGRCEYADIVLHGDGQDTQVL